MLAPPIARVSSDEHFEQVPEEPDPAIPLQTGDDRKGDGQQPDSEMDPTAALGHEDHTQAVADHRRDQCAMRAPIISTSCSRFGDALSATE